MMPRPFGRGGRVEGELMIKRTKPRKYYDEQTLLSRLSS